MNSECGMTWRVNATKRASRGMSPFVGAARLALAVGLSVLGLSVLGACSGGRAGRAASEAQAQLQEDRAAESVAMGKATEMVRQAQRYEVSNKPELALEKYRQAVDVYRDLPAAWTNMGLLLANKGDRLKASEAYMIASELSPTDPRPLHNLGVLWEESDDGDAAKWYQRALERDPNYLPSLRRMIVLDMKRDVTDEASQARLKRAMLAEKDGVWMQHYKRAQIRFKGTMEESAGVE